MRSALAFVLACSSADALRVAIAPVMRADSPSRAKKLPKGLPRNIADRVSFATGGVKTANQVEEVEILWNAFKSVYKNEKLAVEAITKNAVPVQPQYSSPTKIKGTYKLLIDRFGKAAAADIIQRNPGVLVCSPAGLSKQSNEEIMKAVELVEFLDANKGPIRFLSGGLFVAAVAFIGYGIVAKGNPEYGLPLIGQCLLGEPGSLYYGACPPP